MKKAFNHRFLYHKFDRGKTFYSTLDYARQTMFLKHITDGIEYVIKK